MIPLIKTLTKAAKESLWLLPAFIILAPIANQLNPEGIPYIGNWDSSKGATTAGRLDMELTEEITLKDAIKIYETGLAVFADARSPLEYQEGHIKGAVSLPIYDHDDIIEEFIMSMPVDTPVVTYCSGPECDDSHNLAHRLRAAGFTRVTVFYEGEPAWKDAGMPMGPGGGGAR